MGAVRRVLSAGSKEANILAVAEQVDELLRVVDQEIEFGEPQDPKDATDAGGRVLAGTVAVADAHNGTLGNVAGSWVETALTVSGLTTVTCSHNLYLDYPEYTVPISGEPNCRWLVFGVMHDGTGQDATSRIAVDVAFMGDTVNTDDIQLRFNLQLFGTAITVGSSNPVLVTLFFTRATRGE